MKVLLINSNQLKQPWPVIPFGLCCLASFLEEAGHQVRALDLCFSKRPEQDIERAVADFQPDLAGVSVRNIDNGTAHKTKFLLKQVLDQIIAPLKKAYDGPIVIGGPAVGISAAEVLEYFGLDLAIRGDGEEAILEMANRLAAGKSLAGIGGVVRREQGRVVEDNPPLPVPDLNLLPRTNPHKYIDVKPYLRMNSPLQIQTKRGCPLNCVYCTYNYIEGRTYRLRDPEIVAEDIEILVRETGVNHIEITDSTFNIPLDHAKNVLKAIIARGLKLRLRTLGLNPGAIDEELIDLMAEVGFQDVDLSAETACDATLAGLGKNYRKKDVIRAARLLAERKIPTSWMLLVGGPGETPGTLMETLETVARVASPWDIIVVGLSIRAYNGAPIAELMLKETPDCTSDNFFTPVGYHPQAISIQEMRDLTRRFWLSHLNIFMYSEDMIAPLFITRLAAFILRVFSPRTPLWRSFILGRRLVRLLGHYSLGGAYFKFKKRKKFAELDKRIRLEGLESGVKH